MSFVLSSCLMFVKLAIAVTDGVYVMLSNVYSVIDSAANSEKDLQQEISEHDSLERSTESFRQIPINRHSNILEAFNRRRCNFTRHGPFMTPFLVDGSCNISEDKRKRSSLREENAPIQAIRHFRDIKGVDNVSSDGKDFLPNLTLSVVNPGCVSVGTSTHIEDPMEAGVAITSNTFESPEHTPSPKKSRSGSGKKASRSSSKKKSRNLKAQGKDSSNPSRTQARKSLTRETRTLTDLSTTTDEDKFSASNRIASAKQEFTETLKYYKFTPLSDSSGDRVILRKTPRNRSPGFAAKSDSKASCNIDTVFKTSEECLPPFYNPRFDMVEGKNRLEMTDTKLLKNEFDNCNTYPSDGSNSDYAGFGYFSDDGPISRVAATKHLHSYVEKPAIKNNWSSMIELMAYEMQKKIRPVNNGHTDNLYDSSSPKTSPKTSVKSLDIDSGYTSLSKDSTTSPKVGNSVSYFSEEKKVEQDSSDNADDTDLNQSKNVSFNGFDKASEVVASKYHFDEKIASMSNQQNIHESQPVTNIRYEHATTEVKDSQSLEKHNDTAESSCDRGSRQLPQSSSVPNKIPANNIPMRDLVTEEQQMNFLDEITERIHQQYKFDNRGENIPMEEWPLLQDIEEHHYTILRNITEAMQERMESEETVKDPLTKMKDFELDFSEFLAYNKTRGCTHGGTGSAYKNKLAELLPDCEELDEYGFPLSSSDDDEDTTITNVDERRKSEGPNHLILQRSNVENPSVQQNIFNSTDSKDTECSINEASTPISKNKSMDLSSCSSDSKPDICFGNTLDKFMNSTFTVNEKDEIKKEISDLDLRTKSPETIYSEKDILDNSLGEKDWAECAAEVSKHYENCISFLEDDDDQIILNSTIGDDSGCDDSDYGNTSNEDLMEQIKMENEVDSIYANLLRPGEMDVDSLLKELDAAFSTPMEDKVPTKQDSQSDAKVNGKDSGNEEKEFPSKCCAEIEDKNDEITFESETVHEERSQIDARVSKVNDKDSGMVEKVMEQKELLSECCTEIENKSDEVVVESVTVQEEHIRNKNVAEQDMELVKLEEENATKIALEEITVCEKYSAGDD